MKKLLKNRVILMITFIFLLFLAVFSSIKLVNVEAMNGISNGKYKYYTSYEIQPGDTLTSIAATYTKDTLVSPTEYIEEVMQNNHLDSDKITAGKSIIIAYYSDEYKK